jgi:ribosome biogenesis protein BMS1
MRSWYEVDVPRFYAPLLTLCMPPDERTKWQGMKTVGEIKKERGIRVKPNPDHLYKVSHVLIISVNVGQTFSFFSFFGT